MSVHALVSRCFGGVLALVVTLASVGAPLPAFAAPVDTLEQDAVVAIAQGYVRERLDALVSLDSYRQPANVDLTKDTAVALSWDALELDGARRLGTGWSDFSLRTRVVEVSVKPRTAEVALVADVDYHYKSSPEVESGIYNVTYRFQLKRVGSSWRIVGIQSDFDGYRVLRDEVSGGIRAGQSFDDSLGAVKSRRRDALAGLADEVKRSAADADLSMLESEPVALAASSYSYYIPRGVNYANRFAPSSAPRWFYYVNGGDCTNFVSQCVWAAYGGYVEGNDTQSKANITNKVRMVPSIWQAGTGGGVSNWESVSSFWTYSISSKTVGPKATGFNNNLKYTNMSSSDLEVGNVLQVRNGSSGSYGHSVYASRLDNSKSGWSRWFVCQHSSDLKDRALTDVINGWGGSNCYMRRLRFGTASFDK